MGKTNFFDSECNLRRFIQLREDVMENFELKYMTKVRNNTVFCFSIFLPFPAFYFEVGRKFL